MPERMWMMESWLALLRALKLERREDIIREVSQWGIVPGLSVPRPWWGRGQKVVFGGVGRSDVPGHRIHQRDFCCAAPLDNTSKCMQAAYNSYWQYTPCEPCKLRYLPCIHRPARSLAPDMHLSIMLSSVPASCS